MKWISSSRWRFLAFAYLIAFPCMTLDVVWILLNQMGGASEHAFVPGTILFVAGQFTMASIAFTGRHFAVASRCPRQSGYDKNWLDLTLGRDLGSAFRAARLERESLSVNTASLSSVDRVRNSEGVTRVIHRRKSPPRNGNTADARVWRVGLLGGSLLCLPFCAATAWTLIDSENWPIREMWPVLAIIGLSTIVFLRPEVRVTSDELVIRGLVGSHRIPRDQVEYAEFTTSWLLIHLRDGGIARARMLPKMSSTEWSGGAATPDSVAYQITQWAKHGEPGA
ncbi:PH (Pleckstrin Homology) domain-containing protein [Kribbella pratensis]|uniref:PH (Pleckstrin Homology) domain-containing protein n=1 Tax=Kribbella pratensis TaxID=2512112 RepID=A0ABY2FQG7_9ACTN|nr:PH (Pleckstrin Homology) domain-containing protein [Kribbella pratensis]